VTSRYRLRTSRIYHRADSLAIPLPYHQVKRPDLEPPENIFSKCLQLYQTCDVISDMASSEVMCTTIKGVFMYTAQANRHGNIIVCKGDVVRNSYRIVFTGTYAECLAVKAGGNV